VDILVVAVLSLALGIAVGALWSGSRSRGAHEAALQDKAALAASLEAERRSGTEKLALLKDAESKLRDAFAALSADALKQNTHSFLQLARTSLSEFQ
jgi:DNA recombination protein RmuC